MFLEEGAVVLANAALAAVKNRLNPRLTSQTVVLWGAGVLSQMDDVAAQT